MEATPVDAGRLNATDYARRLLDDLGAAPLRAPSCTDEHPALAWARSGLMALTGAADGVPQLCPAPLTTCADGALAALASLAPTDAFDGLRGAQLLLGAAPFGHLDHQRGRLLQPLAALTATVTSAGLTTLELQYSSPKLQTAESLELCVPGTYKPHAQVVKIHSFAQTLTVIGGEILASKGTLDRPISGLVMDSRRVVPGTLFFALPGLRRRKVIPERTGQTAKEVSAFGMRLSAARV